MELLLMKIIFTITAIGVFILMAKALNLKEEVEKSDDNSQDLENL